MKYRLYIDEVGNPDLESSENPNHRFLSITGVIFELVYIKKVVFPELESLKQKFFVSHPDEPIIFHRKEIVNAKHPFEALKDHNFLDKPIAPFASRIVMILSRKYYQGEGKIFGKKFL